jgi:transcriptional regulator with XRE-family HTH domain
MDMPEIIKTRRAELGLSQADLAVEAGVDKRQIRRYEAGETQPTLSVAAAIARALGLSLDELAGEVTGKRADLSGEWWACWQSWKDGQETINPQHVAFRQRADMIEVSSVSRGTAVEDGGYTWQGELRLWDNEILMGWYVANEGAVRSKGTMYFAIHRHGTHMFGRWVGLSYDGPVVTGWSTMARTEEEAVALMDQLRESGKVPV